MKNVKKAVAKKKVVKKPVKKQVKKTAEKEANILQNGELARIVIVRTKDNTSLQVEGKGCDIVAALATALDHDEFHHFLGHALQIRTLSKLGSLGKLIAGAKSKSKVSKRK